LVFRGLRAQYSNLLLTIQYPKQEAEDDAQVKNKIPASFERVSPFMTYYLQLMSAGASKPLE
jgi:hypothetical protein